MTDQPATTPDTPPADPEETPATPTAEDIAKLQRALSRERSENKSLSSQISKLKTSSMTEQEKAVAAAKEEGAKEAVIKAGKRLAAAEFRAAAAGRLADPSAAIDYLDMARFVGDDGEIDTKAINAAVEKLAAASGNGAPQLPVLPQGPRGEKPETGDWLQEALHAKH